MFLKIIRDFLIVFGLVVLFASTNRTAMKYLSDKRGDEPAWWGTYQFSNGDLVSMSYLDMMDNFRMVRDFRVNKPPQDCPEKVNLYLFGDSYARRLRDTAFSCINKYTFLKRFENNLHYGLDTNEKNILIIEISERYFRDYFSTLRILDEVYDSTKKNKNTTLINKNKANGVNMSSFSIPITVDAIFNKNINQNLQYNLFNYNFVFPIFESKALLNFYLFNRASGDVVISKNKKYLFLKETLSPTEKASSFSVLPKEELNNIISNLNKINEHYLNEGFKEVYLSIIPNAVTIEQSEGYNNLIPEIQYNIDLKIKMINIYSFFKNNEKETWYFAGDTHWNKKGTQAWLNIVNDILQEKNK